MEFLNNVPISEILRSNKWVKKAKIMPLDNALAVDNINQARMLYRALLKVGRRGTIRKQEGGFYLVHRVM